MPQGNAFSSSSRAQMGSRAQVNQNQGGGDKKAGFPYQVGRDSWVSIYFNSTNPVAGHCCKLPQYQFTLFPKTSISKPIGSVYRPNTYFHIPGTR